MTTLQEDVDALLTELDGASPEEILAEVARRYAGRVAFASSLGAEDQVLTHMIATAALDIPIFTLDTGRLYPETYDLLDATAKHYNLCIKTYFPAAAEVEKMVDRDGINLFRDSIEARHRCCEVRKIMPLRRAQLELGAWICGLRSGQGATRQKVELAEWDQLADMVKVNPLASWDEARVWDFIRANDVPVQPAARPGLPQHRLRAVHARRRGGRGLARRPLVVGAPRAPRVRPARPGGADPRERRRHRDRRLRSLPMNQLDTLEAKSVHILREAYRNLGNVCMLWSIGKDSTVLLHLARKAFFGHVPIPLVHVDTAYKMPEMIEYRDRLALEWRLNLIVGQNRKALEEKATFPDGNCDRIQCCRNLKTMALKHTLSGEWTRQRMDHTLGHLVDDEDHTPYTGVIVGVRADEEGSRSKERYFSPRDVENDWNVDDQPPELWRYFKTDFEPGTHVRVHPLLDWTELNVWEYIERENIPVTSLYFDDGTGHRCRSLGCWPCTSSVESDAKDIPDIIRELRTGKFSNIAERSGRAQDKDDGGGLESLRRGGYM